MRLSVNDNQSLWHDFRQALYLHVAAMLALLIYACVADFVQYLYGKPLPTHVKTVSVEFVVPSLAVKNDAASLDRPQKKHVIHSDSRPSTKDHSLPPPKVRHASPKKVQDSPLKSQRDALRSKGAGVPKVSDKRPNKPASNDVFPKTVQRQASVHAKMTKTSVAKKVSLDKAVGEKAKQSLSKLGALSKQAQLDSSDGVLNQANAQVLGSKKVQSSGAQKVQKSLVKKTVDRLTKHDDRKKSTLKKSLPLGAPLEPVAKPINPDKKSMSKEKIEMKAQRDLALAKSLQLAEEEKKRSENAKALQRAAEEEKKRQAAIAEVRRQAEIARENSIISEYGQMIIGHIQRHALFSSGMSNLRANLKIKLAHNGNVLAVVLAGSSGNASFDRLAISAVYKASPLPLPSDAAIVEKMLSINLVVSPGDLQS